MRVVEQTRREATVLLAALAFGHAPGYASFCEAHPHAEHALKEAGLLRSAAGPHCAAVSSDIRFSLRHADDEHLAAERGEACPGRDPAGGLLVTAAPGRAG